jgi:tRNA(Ile)-lysidine synthase
VRLSGDGVTDVEREIRNAVATAGLLEPQRPLIAMISGGRDSTCLLDVAVSLLGAGVVRALHVNFGLRAEADGDERHCAQLCARLGVPLEVARAGAPPPGNLHAWARELRYGAAFAAAAAAGERARVASGHTASDQVETILYRLAASPGRRALLGMAPVEGRLVRPLLGIDREQTAAYCLARGLTWREDASNDDRRFARARVRNELLPALRAVHPAAEANVLRTAALLREESELLATLVTAELGGAGRIALARLAELPAALARAVLVALAEQAAGQHVPQAGEHVAEIIALGSRTPRSHRAELHVGGLVAAVVGDGFVEMRKLPPRA